jgi:hypothetical protein
MRGAAVGVGPAAAADPSIDGPAGSGSTWSRAK